MSEQQDAYTKTESFPPYMARALRYALENGENSQDLAAELVAYPIPEGAPMLSHPLGVLNADGSVTTQLPVPAATQTAEQAPQDRRIGEVLEVPGRGVWMSPDGVHLVIETDDGELDGLQHDADAGSWLLVGFYDVVPDEFERLLPVREFAEGTDRPGSPVTETTKQPRVFFKGDTVPAGMSLVNNMGGVIGPHDEEHLVARTYVGISVPSPSEWQSIVDRARVERSGDTTETEKR